MSEWVAVCGEEGEEPVEIQTESDGNSNFLSWQKWGSVARDPGLYGTIWTYLIDQDYVFLKVSSISKCCEHPIMTDHWSNEV